MALRISGLSNGGASRFTIRLVLLFMPASRTCALGACALTSFSSGMVTQRHVMSNVPATKPRIAVERPATMRDFDAVEIGLALLPVVRVAHQLACSLLLELGELERPGADRLGAHLGGRDVAGIDRAVARGEQHQQRRLRLLEVEGRLVVAVGRDLLEIAVPGRARILAQLALALPFSMSQVHLTSAEVKGLPSCHMTPWRSLKVSWLPSSLQRPALGKVGHDRVRGCSAASAGRTSPDCCRGP